MITIMPTAECNLDCPYCYLPKTSELPSKDLSIDIDFAKAGILEYFSSNPPYLRFFGAGEPTLAFDKMQAIYAYAYSLAKDDLIVELQTNGYFGDEISDWIHENVNILWISCDGPSDIQDIQRPCKSGLRSSEVVIRNIERLSRSKKQQVGVRFTVSETNYTRQTDIIDFFYDLGIKYVCGSPTFTSINEEKTPSFMDFAANFVPAFQHALDLGMFYQTHFMVNFDEKVETYCRACLPCPHLTPDGHISCCDWALLGPKKLPIQLRQLIYGHWDKKICKIVYDEEKIENIQARTIHNLVKDACAGCGILRNCAGGCLGKNMMITNKLNQPMRSWCSAVRYLAKHLPIIDGPFPSYHS